MKKNFLALFAFLTVLFAGSEAFALVDVEARYWFSNLDDKLKISSGSTIGTEIDIVNELGVDDKKGFLDGRITLELGNHKIRYGFMPMKWDGSKSLSRTIVFDGRTYSASTSVESDLKVNYHRLGYQYDFYNVMQNHAGVIFEIKYFDAEARIKAPSAGIDEAHSVNVPIPTVGLSVQAGLPFLINVGAEATGVRLGKKAYLVDAEAGVNFKPAPFIVVSGGYRIFRLHLEENDDLADIKVKGPFVMLRADF